VSRNYRPIWTFNNKINNKVNFIFYGLNEFPISFYNSKNTLNNVGWDLMNWPSYVSWNKSFTNYLHKSFTKPFIYNIFDEPVWYRDSSDEMDLSFKSNGLITIALYDVSPVRKSLNYPWTKRSSYINSSKNVIKFYTDILSLQIKYKFNILIKTKKNHGYKTDKNYAFFIKKIAKSSNMIFITSQNKSPKLINKEVNAIISYPFTSAAYFNDKNIPSIYYDPTASIDINKQINFGVSTINRISDLEKWILKIIN
jgi:polysaccharide biosynthesis PFTS motif protein